MSQFFDSAPRKPPSRRGTPSSNDPIPYFGNQSNASGSAETDFFASIGTSQQNSSIGGAYQNMGYHAAQPSQTAQPQQQPQPQTYAPYQPYSQQPVQPQPSASLHGQYQQGLYNQLPPRDIPPRSATGPAVEYPYQNYGYTSQQTKPAGVSSSAYRSASVVYGGNQYDSSYGYQATPAGPKLDTQALDGAAFFDQLVGTSSAAQDAVVPAPASYAGVSLQAYSPAPQYGPNTDPYSSQYANQYGSQAAADASSSMPTYGNSGTADASASAAAAAATTSGEEAATGVIFDEAMGQYYDTATGQYYDDAAAAWYYPQQSTGYNADGYTQATELPGAGDTTVPGAAVEVADGAAFFDNLVGVPVDSQDHSASLQDGVQADDTISMASAAIPSTTAETPSQPAISASVRPPSSLPLQPNVSENQTGSHAPPPAVDGSSAAPLDAAKDQAAQSAPSPPSSHDIPGLAASAADSGDVLHSDAPPAEYAPNEVHAASASATPEPTSPSVEQEGAPATDVVEKKQALGDPAEIVEAAIGVFAQEPPASAGATGIKEEPDYTMLGEHKVGPASEWSGHPMQADAGIHSNEIYVTRSEPTAVPLPNATHAVDGPADDVEPETTQAFTPSGAHAQSYEGTVAVAESQVAAAAADVGIYADTTATGAESQSQAAEVSVSDVRQGPVDTISYDNYASAQPTTQGTATAPVSAPQQPEHPAQLDSAAYSSGAYQVYDYQETQEEAIPSVPQTSLAARPSLPTPSLSATWSVQAEHASASSIADPAAEIQALDYGAGYAAPATDAAAETMPAASAAAIAATDNVVAAPYDSVAFGDPSYYYSEEYNAQQTAAAVATVGYESLDAQAQAATDAAGFGSYTQPLGSAGFAAADSVPAANEYPQPQPAWGEYSGDSAYTEYTPYSGAHSASVGYTIAEEATVHQAPANDASLDQQQYHEHQAAVYSPQAPAPSDGYQNIGIADTANPYGAESLASAASPVYGNDVGPGSHRAISSLSAPNVAPPTAIFDFHSHSERTSAELSHYDRDLDAAGQEQASAGLSDPLGRLNARHPILSFGFGGRLVTMFPRQVQRFSMYDSGKASKIVPGMLQIQQLSDHIAPEQCAQSTTAYFNTPLLTGETTRSALLKRRDVAVACARAWVDSATSANALEPDEKALYEVVIAILDSFGQNETAQVDLAGAVEPIRSLFADNDAPAQPNGASAEHLSTDSYAPITHGSTAQLKEIEALLLEGKREEAVASACRQGLWTHALIIASCTGKSLWQSVVSAYTESVLKDGLSALGTQYRIFSGLGQKALDRPRPFHKRDLSTASDKFITAADIGGSMDGIQDGEQQCVSGAGVLPDNDVDHVTQDWAKMLSLMLANRTSGDQAAILKLGDKLKDSGRVAASHICYVLTLQSREIFLPESGEALPRASLLGVDEAAHSSSLRASAFDTHRSRYSRYYRKQSAMCLTELYEVAFALRAVAIGDNRSAGSAASGAPAGSSTSANPSSTPGAKLTLPLCLPHLQAYKLYYAWWLTDCGQTALASRYCDAVLSILATLPRGVAIPFVHASLVQELRNLRERLTGAGMPSAKAAEIVGDDAAIAGGSSKSWLSRAMPRPSFTSLISAFDSSIDKFITGADGRRISLDTGGGTAGKYEVGPDRQNDQTTHDPEHPQPPRALGAVGYGSLPPSPRAVPAGVEDGSTTAPFAMHPQGLNSSLNAGMYYADSNAGTPAMLSPVHPAPQADQAVPGFSPHQQAQQHVSQPQWGDPGNDALAGDDGAFITPGIPYGIGGATAGTTFGYSNGAASSSAPPASQHATGYASTAAEAGAAAQVPDAGDDEEDMFGFSKKRAPKQPAQEHPRPSVDAPRSSAPPAQPPSDADGAKARSSTDGKEGDKDPGGGVFGIFKSFWGGRKNQANLGEDSHFVYDPVQQRWVDKNAPDAQQDTGPLPPPPPSMMKFQPQSASVPPPAGAPLSPPGLLGQQQQQQQQPYHHSSTATPLGAGNVAPPPSRTSTSSRPPSAIPPPGSADLSRAGTPSSMLDPAAMGGMPPPSSGSARAGKRRGARSKYVDLLNQ